MDSKIKVFTHQRRHFLKKRMRYLGIIEGRLIYSQSEQHNAVVEGDKIIYATEVESYTTRIKNDNSKR